jgi:hypothetical protein
MIVTYQEAKELNYCNRGLRQFFDKHGLDYQEFKSHGIDHAVLAAINDAMANDLIQYSAKMKGIEVV